MTTIAAAPVGSNDALRKLELRKADAENTLKNTSDLRNSFVGAVIGGLGLAALVSPVKSGSFLASGAVIGSLIGSIVGDEHAETVKNEAKLQLQGANQGIAELKAQGA